MGLEGNSSHQEAIIALAASVQGGSFLDVIHGVTLEETTKRGKNNEGLVYINFDFGAQTYNEIKHFHQSDGVSIGFITDLDNIVSRKEYEDSVADFSLKIVYSPTDALQYLKTFRKRAEDGLTEISKVFEMPDRAERALRVQESEPGIVENVRILLASTSFLHGIAREALNQMDLTLALLCCDAAGDFEQENRFQFLYLNYGDIILEEAERQLQDRVVNADTLELYCLKELIAGIAERNKPTMITP